MSMQPQLSTASTALQELTARITDLAAEAAQDRREDVAGVLYEIERSLRAAARRLEQLVSELR